MLKPKYFRPIEREASKASLSASAHNSKQFEKWRQFLEGEPSLENPWRDTHLLTSLIYIQEPEGVACLVGMLNGCEKNVFKGSSINHVEVGEGWLNVHISW